MADKVLYIAIEIHPGLKSELSAFAELLREQGMFCSVRRKDTSTLVLEARVFNKSFDLDSVVDKLPRVLSFLMVEAHDTDKEYFIDMWVPRLHCEGKSTQYQVTKHRCEMVDNSIHEYLREVPTGENLIVEMKTVQAILFKRKKPLAIFDMLHGTAAARDTAREERSDYYAAIKEKLEEAYNGTILPNHRRAVLNAVGDYLLSATEILSEGDRTWCEFICVLMLEKYCTADTYRAEKSTNEVEAFKIKQVLSLLAKVPAALPDAMVLSEAFVMLTKNTDFIDQFNKDVIKNSCKVVLLK